ncbi:hypothetical protein LZ31DRAFT_601927 [Colletotrichum somersetense]|nr:hypothetical protein LZ31DRAFT_601927 [Colletotrichum somersetense]
MAASSDKSKTRFRVEKRGGTLKRKTVCFRQLAGVFSATVYWHPRLREYQGAIHVPKGQNILDVSQFISEHLWRAKQDRTAAEIVAESGSSDGGGVLG